MPFQDNDRGRDEWLCNAGSEWVKGAAAEAVTGKDRVRVNQRGLSAMR